MVWQRAKCTLPGSGRQAGRRAFGPAALCFVDRIQTMSISCPLLFELNKVQPLCVFPSVIQTCPRVFFPPTGLLPVKSRAGPQCGIPRRVPAQCKARSGLLMARPRSVFLPGERELHSLLLSPPASHTCPTLQTRVLTPLQLSSRSLSRVKDARCFLRDPLAGKHHIQLHCTWSLPTVVITHHEVSSSHRRAGLLESWLRSSVM